MAHSRLERIGTIYTRVTGLIKSGAMKIDDRPLWYDLYQAFPPKYPPQYDRPFPTEAVKPIFYHEDIIRAKYYKAVRNSPIPNLKDTENQTLCQKCISICTKLQEENNLPLDEAFQQALQTVQSDVESKTISKTENDEVLGEGEKPSVDIKGLFN